MTAKMNMPSCSNMHIFTKLTYGMTAKFIFSHFFVERILSYMMPLKCSVNGMLD